MHFIILIALVFLLLPGWGWGQERFRTLALRAAICWVLGLVFLFPIVFVDDGEVMACLSLLLCAALFLMAGGLIFSSKTRFPSLTFILLVLPVVIIFLLRNMNCLPYCW